MLGGAVLSRETAWIPGVAGLDCLGNVKFNLRWTFQINSRRIWKLKKRGSETVVSPGSEAVVPKLSWLVVRQMSTVSETTTVLFYSIFTKLSRPAVFAVVVGFQSSCPSQATSALGR